MIYTVLTVGAGALTSLAKTAIKEISEGVSLNVIGSKLLKTSVEKMDDVWQKAKCTILSIGCFAAGTLVATAQGNTPIEFLHPSSFITSKYEHSDGGQNLSGYTLAYNINSEENLSTKSPLDYDNLEITPEGWKWVFFAITGDDCIIPAKVNSKIRSK